MTHVLDRPVWNTLSSHHAVHGVGTTGAKRFVAEIGPLAGTPDDDPSSLAALADLVSPNGSVLLLQADPIVLSNDLVALKRADGVQLTADRLATSAAWAHDVVIEELGERDYAAMLELATLTRPGPFAVRTPILGSFVGVRNAQGALIAMAGERMKHDGFTEVSGVCTHPDARGRGLARLLSSVVAARILEGGARPYLHAYASNTAAIALYESLGFRLRTQVHVAVVMRRDDVA